ncbi:MAG: ribosomal protein S18-alanine N-acetyltransferase [Clostridiaceae bacterium]|nr:ribosomal protein S18-alanine N-acetyltransferase [Clostridiaceae bacterium]
MKIIYDFYTEGRENIRPTLIPVQADTVELWHDIEAACFQASWGMDSCRDFLSERTNHVWAFSLDGGETLIGAAALQVLPPEAELLRLAIKEPFRRHGFGRQFMTALIKWLRDEGVNRMWLEVRVSNEPAISLYESLGFERNGLRKRYYKNNDEDAYTYGRTI